MATTAKNRILKTVNQRAIFDAAANGISSAVTFNQGDLLYLDTTAHLLKALDSNAHAATFAGIARVSVVAGKLASPYSTSTDASEAAGGIPGPVDGVVAKMIAKTGDVFNFGDSVYFDTDAQHVTSTAPMSPNAVGVYVGPTAVTATAGQEIEIYLKSPLS